MYSDWTCRPRPSQIALALFGLVFKCYLQFNPWTWFSRFSISYTCSCSYVLLHEQTFRLRPTCFSLLFSELLYCGLSTWMGGGCPTRIVTISKRGAQEIWDVLFWGNIDVIARLISPEELTSCFFDSTSGILLIVGLLLTLTTAMRLIDSKACKILRN